MVRVRLYPGAGAAALLPGGLLGDRYGRKKVLLGALAAIPVGMTLRQAWDAADVGWRRTILSLVVVKVVLYPGLPGRRVWPADDSPLLERAKALGGPWCFDPSKIDIQWKV
jgi:MFS family permease